MLRLSTLLGLISLALFARIAAANTLPSGDSLAYSEAKHRALDTVQVTQYFLDDSKMGAFYTTSPDTSLQRFQFNQPHQKSIPAWFMQCLLTGAVGSAVLNPDDPFNYQSTGFLLGRERAYRPYRLLPEETPIYRTHRAYSNLSYGMGANAETMIDVVHAQQLGKKFYGQLQFRNYGSEGAYTFQKTAHKNAHTFLEYKVKNNYLIAAGLLINDSRLQENGGTLNDSVFLQNYIDKNVVPVRRNATQTFKDEIYYFNQTYHPKNTSKHWYIQHHFRSSAQYQHYSDKKFDSLNYPFAQLSLAEGDSLVFNAVMHNYSNELNWYRNSFSDSTRNHPFKFKFGLRHEYILAKIAQQSPFWNQLEAHAYIEKGYDFKKKYWTTWFLENTYYLSGYNQGNYSVRASFNQSVRKLGSWVNYSLHAYIYSRSADFLQQYGAAIPSGNNPSVEYLIALAPLKNQGQYLGATLHLGSRDAFRLRVKYNLLRINQLVYLDSTARINMLNRTTMQQRWSIEGMFAVKNWHLQTALRWNRGMSYPLQMPTMSSYANLYYEKHYFNNALEAQIGMDAIYMKGFYTPTFEPLWNDFSAQNTRLFNYQPSLGFFINARIEDARIFLRIDQLLQGVNGKGNYTGYAYPQYDRAFHVGVSWQFKD
jgi:hypothetical protein